MSQNENQNWQNLQALVMDIRDRLQSASYSINMAVQNIRKLTQLLQRMAPQRTTGGGLSQGVQDAQTPNPQSDVRDED